MLGKRNNSDIFGAVTRIAIFGCVCAKAQKGWRHSTWRPSLSCSLTTNWFHVFSGCKVFLKTRAAEKTCNRFCVCVHLHFKLASQHVAAIFLSQVISGRIGVWSIRLLSLFQDSCDRENPKTDLVLFHYHRMILGERDSVRFA